jgi:hypothetical protein
MTTSENYVFKNADYMIGDTVTCVYQYRQVKGFVVGMAIELPGAKLNAIQVVMDVSKTEFIKSYVKEAIRPKWEYSSILAPSIYSFRLAPTKCVLFEKVHKWPTS